MNKIKQDYYSNYASIECIKHSQKSTKSDRPRDDVRKVVRLAALKFFPDTATGVLVEKSLSETSEAERGELVQIILTTCAMNMARMCKETSITKKTGTARTEILEFAKHNYSRDKNINDPKKKILNDVVAERTLSNQSILKLRMSRNAATPKRPVIKNVTVSLVADKDGSKSSGRTKWVTVSDFAIGTKDLKNWYQRSHEKCTDSSITEAERSMHKLISSMLSKSTQFTGSWLIKNYGIATSPQDAFEDAGIRILAGVVYRIFSSCANHYGVKDVVDKNRTESFKTLNEPFVKLLMEYGYDFSDELCDALDFVYSPSDFMKVVMETTETREILNEINHDEDSHVFSATMSRRSKSSTRK